MYIGVSLACMSVHYMLVVPEETRRECPRGGITVGCEIPLGAGNQT